MHGLDRVVEEIAGCEITMKILKTHKDNKSMIGYIYLNFTSKA